MSTFSSCLASQLFRTLDEKLMSLSLVFDVKVWDIAEWWTCLDSKLPLIPSSLQQYVAVLYYLHMHFFFGGQCWKIIYFSFQLVPSSGVATAYICLQTILSSTSVSFTPTSPISSLTKFNNIFFGLPLFLFPDNSISIIFLPTSSLSLLMTCSYHLSLPSLIFIPNRSTLTVPMMYLFLILSFLITPIANLNIFISATSISFTFFFVITTVSSPYTIAGLTTELYTFSFTLAGNLLLQIIPDTFLHPFQNACTFLHC